jgi:WD40 repeat protein
MAFASDGNLLALGFADGKVRVFALPAFAGVATFETEDNAITGLAFGHDAVRTSDSGSLSGARLVASDRAGGIFVWELAKRRLLGRLRETSLEVVALAFSPDGTLLASGGRGEVRLWDIVNEHSVLRLTGAGPMDYATAVAFSPDGTRLAGSSRRVLHPAHTWIAELSPHRGIQLLYGLNGWIERVWLSSDGRYVAALAQNWRLGVWETATGRLLHVFAGLEGSLPDNTAVVIHPDGRLYFSSAQMVRVWKLASGQASDAIRLPYGLCDAMKLTANGRLLLLRREAGIVSKGPYTWKLRDLLGADPAAVLHSQTDRSWGSYYCAIAPDGNSFVVTGPSATKAPVRQECVVVYDTATGNERWRSNYPAAFGHISPIFSWDGGAVGCALDGTNSHWLSLANGSLVDAGPFDLLTPEFQSNEVPDGGFGLHRRGDAKHRLILGAQYGPIRSSAVSPDGRLLAWGTERGVVVVAHLEQIQRRLKEFGAGLEW